MKNHSTPSPRPHSAAVGFGSSLMIRSMLVAGCLGLAISATHARASELEVGVRTKIIDKEHIWTNTNKAAPGTGGHGKVYGILAVKEIKADWKLVKPVDENAVLQILSQELNRNGFRLYSKTEKPEIILTVSYGRGEVENPYYQHGGGEGENAGDNRAAAFAGGSTTNDSGATTSVINGAFSQQLLDEKGFGYEANLQKAATEKLYIRVVAWAYPTDPKARAKQLWKCTMVVDDPDHRDLNAVAAKMLEAGAPYFDHEIRDPEVAIFKPLPDGRVNVGAPEVISPKAKYL